MGNFGEGGWGRMKYHQVRVGDNPVIRGGILSHVYLLANILRGNHGCSFFQFGSVQHHFKARN